MNDKDAALELQLAWSQEKDSRRRDALYWGYQRCRDRMVLDGVVRMLGEVSGYDDPIFVCYGLKRLLEAMGVDTLEAAIIKVNGGE